METDTVKNGITKEQSKILQGLSILMMLYHHLFSTPEALGTSYYSILNIGGINIELKMAWFFKICVGIYAFVSGYGLCKTLVVNNEKNKESFWGHLLSDYVIVLKKLFSFMISYWIVFAIFVPIGFVFYDKAFDFSEFILNMFGFRSTYNGAWWYVLQYMKMLMLLPVVNGIFVFVKKKKYVFAQCGFYLILLITFLTLYFVNKNIVFDIIEFFQPSFLLCFLMGYFIARFRIYEICYKLMPEKILYSVGVLGFLLVIIARVKMAKDASSAGLDFVFVPVFVYGFLCIMLLLNTISKILVFFGRYSTFIWLTHVFFYDHYAKKVVMFSGISTGIYFTLLVLSLTAAVILTYISKIFKKPKIC